MSSEMRVTDAMVTAALDAQPLTDENESWRVWQIIGFDNARAEKIMRSALNAALLARTEAGPSLLCQSDACAHKGTVHNFCTPRTEAGADGAVDSRAAFERWAKPQGYRLHIRDTPGSARLGQYGDDSTQAAWEAWTASRTTHPQDASGDAEDSDRIADLIGGAQTPVVCEDGDANCTLWDILANAFGDDDIGNAREWVRETVYHAMQAKEAK